MSAVVQRLGEFFGNELYCLREDLFPYSFGGNKARKAAHFFKEIDDGPYDCVVSYGSGSSNHCRVVSNLCAARGLLCILISPQEAMEQSYNLQMTELFGAQRISVPVERVHDTIEDTLRELRNSGRTPYFIPGGGHGNLGTQTYVECFQELLRWQEEQGVELDEIYLASGTGTTQAGLICGKLLSHSGVTIRGISIARKNPRGREVVLQSVREYLHSVSYPVSETELSQATVFLDDYTFDGYGSTKKELQELIRRAMIRYGLPLDSTYTAKAFYGMEEDVKSRNRTDARILFIHTGGTPLFFDDLKKMGKLL